MIESERFKINTPKVVHETIDGEVVIVNLEKGHYYSLVKTGVDIWAGIEQGMARGDILAEMVQRYNGSREDIEKGVNTLLEELQTQELIIVDKTNTNGATHTVGVIHEVPLAFEPPNLEKYTDMEDLLLLDPIHEVDEMGWPSAK